MPTCGVKMGGGQGPHDQVLLQIKCCTLMLLRPAERPHEKTLKCATRSRSLLARTSMLLVRAARSGMPSALLRV